MGETFNNLIIGDNNIGNTQQVGLLEDALAELLDKIAALAGIVVKVSQILHKTHLI